MDCEKTDYVLPEDNIDISKSLCVENVKKEDESFEEYYYRLSGHFIKKISQYQKINTNRLHVAIAAAKLGKEVNLYPNSYWKNKALFEFTMEYKYKNVKFHYKKGKVLPDDLRLSEKIVLLIKESGDLSREFSTDFVFFLVKTAWNYAVTLDYSILQEVFAKSSDKKSHKSIEKLLTCLIENKKELFPEDERLITECGFSVLENGQVSVSVEFKN